MKALFFFVPLLALGCASSDLKLRPTPADTRTSSSTKAAISNASSDKYLQFLRDKTGASRIIQVNDGGAFGGSALYTLADDMLSVEYFDEHGNREERRKISPAVAVSAWQQIARLDIPHWRQRYAPEDIAPGMQIFDGTQWQVTLCDGAQGYFSSGNNVYPALLPIGAPTLETTTTGQLVRNAYRELFSLLQSLVKEPNS